MGDETRPDIAIPHDIYFGLSYGPDLVQEEGNKLFVVDQHPFGFEGGNLFVFERANDGSFEEVAEVELGFPVERMIVHGDQAILLGNDFNWFVVADHTEDGGPTFAASAGDIAPVPNFPQTVAVTVNLGAEVEVIRQKFEGLYHEIHHQDDQIVIVSSVGSDATIAIYPPPLLSGLVTTYDITNDGLREVASAEIPLFGMTRIHKDDFYSANTVPSDIVFLAPPEVDGNKADDPNLSSIRPPDEPVPPTVSVSRYFLGEDGIRQVDTLDLGLGFLMDFAVAPDGQTGIVVRSEFSGVPSGTSVDLLDLSGDGVRIFETIRLNDFSGHALVTGPDYVVLRSYENNSLVVIDANQSIDVAAENRIRRIEIPANLNVHYEHLQVTDDRLVLRAHRVRAAGDDGVTTDANGLTIADVPRDNILLTISISEARIIADTHLPDDIVALPHERMFLIDSETQRFGFLAHAATATSLRRQFVFGHLNRGDEVVCLALDCPELGEVGEFHRDGAIPVGAWLEIDANADRLIVRESDRLLEYDWGNVEEPRITPLGDPDPTIEAVNDEYTLTAGGEDHLLDVLANDVIHHFGFDPIAEIVELIGAPEGAEIVRGNMIRIPAEALEGVENLRFEYVISNGQERSSAVVEIDVLAISEDQVRELVEAIRRDAAEYFDVRVDEIEITFVERIFTEPLPVVLPGEPEIDLSPGILVTLKAPNGSALYAASLEGEIIQVLATRREREALVDLGLRAVDANGETLETVAEGDNFWLEFNAKDLREFGLGVYAAFFDLLVPTEHLVITGPVEYGPGFTSIRGGDFDEGEIDDLGAIGDEIDHPGNGRQSVLRVAVRATGAGEITLQPEPADDPGTATLIRGRETEVPEGRVRYTPLTLNIVKASDGDPLDADGSGDVSATDALVVINFLGRYGTTLLEELEATIRGVTSEGEDVSQQKLESMRRFDTTRNGTISALDALVVINRMGQEKLADETAEAEDDETIVPEQVSIHGLDGNRLF